MMATFVSARLMASSTTMADWMPSGAANRNIERSVTPAVTHWVMVADPAAGVMILVMPFSWRYLSPASATPVLTVPMTPERSLMDASSWAIRAPRSFLASSSRSMTSNLIFLSPTCTPPAALISAMASFAPSRMETPMGADPPENGPVIAIFIESAAATPAAIRIDINDMRIAFFMFVPPMKNSDGHSGRTIGIRARRACSFTLLSCPLHPRPRLRPLRPPPPSEVPHHIEHDQRGKKNHHHDIDDVAVAEHGAPVVPQGEAAPREERVPGSCTEYGEETEREKRHASHAGRDRD